MPVILSGGSGTRLWPLSRKAYPKQFLSLTGDKTLFQLTLSRLQALDTTDVEVLPPLLVGNEAHRFIMAEQAHSLGVEPSGILLEPVARNTAPAVAAAAIAASAQGLDPLLLILPADHVIQDVDAFSEAVRAGVASAQAGRLLTFGVVPNVPETGYGYIKLAGPAVAAQAQAVAAFVEKPDLATAQRYLDEGCYLWNSGMFLFRASVFLAELDRLEPAIAAAVRASMEAGKADHDFFRLGRSEFSASPADSIDYAVMEASDKVSVVPLQAGWSDVGAWDAVWQNASKDGHGNASYGDVVLRDCVNTHIHADHRLVVALGIDDAVIVETPDAVLVADKSRAQDVKAVVDQLKADRRAETDLHRKVYRPWGDYDSIAQGARYQVKCITVKPGHSLSVQMHHHRAEHWIVVSGTAKVSIGEKEILLTENQSTYIPLGVIHALENPGKIPLELIEVQSGAYLGEDDIVRFSDRYGREIDPGPPREAQ